ncbi:MAG: homoserine dehydrogenase [Sumerlaeia bacterium]
MNVRFPEHDTSTSEIMVGIIGLGAMGRGLLYQTLITPGIRCACVAELDVKKASQTLRQFGIEHHVIETAKQLSHCIETGVLALCQDGGLLAAVQQLDVVIEATSAIAEGLRFSEIALKNGNHLVLMNAEIDLIFGSHLHRLAQQHGVHMTSCDGDQHGVILRLVKDLRLWGFQLVLGGNIKGFLDRRANPVSIIPEADKRNLDYKMCASYTDGTKLNVEMALLANCLGMRAQKTGMHGPRAAEVNQALELFDLESMRQSGGGVVDYLLGAKPDGGVFAVGFQDDPWQAEMLNYYKMGSGPYYLFYRPYHLCHVEAMQCVFDVVAGKPLLQPLQGFQTNVFAFAKVPLKAGTLLDGIGGHSCYGLIENTNPKELPLGLPICLADDVRLKHDVPQDQPIMLADVHYSSSAPVFAAYLGSYCASNVVYS